MPLSIHRSRNGILRQIFLLSHKRIVPFLELLMGLFIWIIAINAQVFFIYQVIDCRTLVGKAIRLHGAYHILLRDFPGFFQRGIVQFFIKTVFDMVIDNNLIPGCLFPLRSQHRGILHTESHRWRVKLHQKLL